MLQNLRDYLKTKPFLYDNIKKIKRIVSPDTDPIYNYFNQFSKTLSRRVNFLQIGASDGLRCDPIREFIIRDNWSGLFVEPLPYAFDLLQKNYSSLKSTDIIFINAAISSVDSDSLSFWTFEDSFLADLTVEQRMDFLRKASFDREHARNFLADDADDKKILKEIKIKCLTIESLLAEFWSGKEIDIIVCDAEGHERAIITSLDFSKIKPKAIYFESHNLKEDKEPLYDFLINGGYKIRELGGDSVALADTFIETFDSYHK